jgi:hypothetical protein
MKMQTDHYEVIAAAISRIPDVNTLIVKARTDGRSDVWIGWGLLRMVKIADQNSMRWLCDTLYPYLDDSHITTALCRIVKNITRNCG